MVTWQKIAAPSFEFVEYSIMHQLVFLGKVKSKELKR